MAATSTRNTPASATKSPGSAVGSSSASGLTPIWIRLPRLSESGDEIAEAIDPEETAPSIPRGRVVEKTASAPVPAERPKSARVVPPPPPAPPIAEEEESTVDDGMPDYLRRLAERAEDDEDEDEVSPPPTRKRSRGERGTKRSASAASGGFLSHLLRAPYNVLAGIALVALFVCLYVYFKPPASSDEALPEIEGTPSLSLELGEPSGEPASLVGAEAVDPDSIYPAMPDMGDGGFQPAPTGEFAHHPAHGVGAANEFAPATPTEAGTPAMAASSATGMSTPSVDEALLGLPLDAYPETDPANYRYPAEATIELPAANERTASGDAPRAASLGDSLEKTPVQGPSATY